MAMHQLPEGVRVVPNAWLAYIAARKLRSKRAALVMGHTIYIYGLTKDELLSNTRLLKHELVHVAQYERYGIPGFLLRYVWYSLRYGYYRNPLEVEARAAETH